MREIPGLLGDVGIAREHVGVETPKRSATQDSSGGRPVAPKGLAALDLTEADDHPRLGAAHLGEVLDQS